VLVVRSGFDLLRFPCPACGRLLSVHVPAEDDLPDDEVPQAAITVGHRALGVHLRVGCEKT